MAVLDIAHRASFARGSDRTLQAEAVTLFLTDTLVGG
jgi:hypothetical protein